MSKLPEGRLNIINRDDYPTFQPSPIIPYRSKKRITAVRLERVDHDKEYARLKKLGRKIDVTSAEIFVNGNQKPDDGIFSPVFGSDTIDRSIPVSARP